MSDTLELYDLDGTMIDIDVERGLDKQSNDEVQHYFIAAAQFVADQTGLDADEVFEGMKVAMLGDIFPNRAKFENWASFPAIDKTPVKVTPAVDHYLLTPRAIELFLNRRLAQEQQEDQQSPVVTKIREFLAEDWKFSLYSFASEASLPHSHISEDAIAVIEDRLRNNALATVFTNSSAAKAETLLAKAGFFGERFVSGNVERGKIGAIGGAAKFEVDTSLSSDRALLDLSNFYGEEVILDLRRRRFRERVDGLLSSTGAERIFMATDIPELDLYPLRAWYGDRIINAMKTNQASAPESIAAARALLNARISDKLSDLVAVL